LPPALLEEWSARVAAEGAIPAGSIALLDAGGGSTTGSLRLAGEPMLRATMADTGLPWTVVLVDHGGAVELVAGRRWLLASGLAAILLLTSGGSYLLWRVVRREFAVSRLQSQFVAAVSHEFRTPLTSMRLVTELLDESDDVPPARRSALYRALGRNVERLHRLVESLLDFSRMEDGRKPYDLRSVDVGHLLADVVREFQAEVAAHGFVVSLDVDRSAALVVLADRAALTQVVWNLLDNATKYSGESRVVEVTLGRAGGCVVVSVTDHGVGIPASERSEIFERFVRGEQARLLGIKGTGLGLALVTHIIRAHHGRVSLESQEGIGSTFTIALPPVDAAQPVAATIEPTGRLRNLEH
jgi:signal transduction histidine kinase